MRGVMQMRKGKHIGPMTPISGGLTKQGNMYEKNKGDQITTAQNPANSMKHGAKVIKQGNQYKMGL